MQVAKPVTLFLFYLLLLMLCAFFLYKVFEYEDAFIRIAENGLPKKTKSSVVNFVIENMRAVITGAIIAAIAFAMAVCSSIFAAIQKKRWNGWLLILLFIITASMAVVAFITIKKIEGHYFLRSRYTHYYFSIAGIFILLAIALAFIYYRNYLLLKKNISYDKQFRQL